MSVIDSLLGSGERAAPGLRSEAPQTAGFRLYRTLCRWLSRATADRVIVVLGFVLLLPSLDTGLAADDYLQTVMLDRPSPMAGFERAPLDLFRFCDPQKFGELLDQGIFSWWDDPQVRLAFMRPISAATHVLDHALFRNQGSMMHLHSALWALLLFLGVRALYRGLIEDRVVANLALALYALDDARGWLVSWVAARNAAIATALSVWCLVMHHASRSKRVSYGMYAGPLLFACALLSGEGAIASCGYLLAYALFIDRGSLTSRSLSLLPYGLLLIVWRVTYRSLGFGAYGSSLYIDPISDPGAYVSYLFRNGPMLLGAQFGGMWSDVSMLFFVAPRVQIALYAATCGFLAWVFFLMRGQLQSSRLSRYALLGMLCAVLPAVTASPAMDRLLTWIAIGASVLLAQLLAPALRDPRGLTGAHKLTIAGLVATHLIGVVFLPSRARGNLVMRDTLGRADAAIPHDPSISDKTLIFVNPPLLPYAAYTPIERAAQGIPRPAAQHILAVAATDITMERLDAHTVRLSPKSGFLLDPTSKLLWNPKTRPFQAGEQIRQRDMQVTVLTVTPDHRPLTIEARFDKPLDDKNYVWVDWRGTQSAPFTPPPVGNQTVLPAADYFQSVLGVKLPLEAKY